MAYPIFYKTNGTLYLDARDFQYSCSKNEGGWNNGLYDFFELEGVTPWTPHNERDMEHICKHVDHSDLFDIRRATGTRAHELQIQSALQLWRPQEWVMDAAGRAFSKLINASHPTVAFHVQGGPDTDSSLTDALIDTARTNYPEIKNGTCIIVGEDPQLNLEVSKKVAKALGCTPVRVKDHRLQQLDKKDAKLMDRCEMAMDQLLDILVLIKADYFVGSYTSALPYVVETLRTAIKGKGLRTSSDASGRRLDLFADMRDIFT